MKKLKNIVFILVSMFIFNFFTGCYDEYINSEEDTWTIFIYLCGSDLESESMAATYNLEEIKQAYLGDNINVIIETGGASQWYTSEIENDKIQRFKIEDGEMTIIDEQHLSNMGDSETLNDFIKWGMENYKSDKNALIFWNHGSGSIGGVAYDENYDYDSLALSELKNSLEQCSDFLDDKFELIGFDACLMSTLETANILEPYAKYLISSQEYEPGEGWAYDVWLEAIADDPSMNGKDAGINICDSYYEKCSSLGTEDMCTLSVIDLAKIPEVINSFNNIADDIYNISKEPSEFVQFSRNASKSENYGGNSVSEGYTNLVDLGDFIRNVKEEIDDNTDAVIDSLNNAVLYKVNGSKREYANGLSIYYPIDYNSIETTEYEKIAFSDDYKNFVIGKYDDFKEPEIDESKFFANAQTYINEDGYYELNLSYDSLDYIKNVYCTIFLQEDENSNELLYLGKDNNLYGDYGTGIFSDAFEGYWPSIDGIYVNMNIIEVNDNYNIYSIPVYLNGEATNLRTAWIWTDYNNGEGYYEIIGTWDGISAEGLSSRNVKLLQNGDVIEPVYESYDMNTDEIIEYIGDEIVVNDATALEEIKLPQGYYYYGFEIEDIYGQTFDTDFTAFEIDESQEVYSLE
ncbi:clostripain-related cysteine peptidase [uncultured Clostridium sp.]|uniref:clostripain-related cysteine peptidase n=1 Tax=uncultured Clostridium sp. TaxID=59620 RepID=UPI0025F15DF9|nr:clostripain-related cysteine peptidase [uncultured Clostridium sp.]